MPEMENGKDKAKSEAEVQKRIDDLKAEIAAATNELNLLQKDGTTKTEVTFAAVEDEEESLPPPGKRGYLMKWQDRAIRWAGSRWEKRFVCLERGRLSYYLNHEDPSPRYVLTLRGCAVRDDGCKLNRQNSSISTKGGKVPSVDEPGAYFHVFSVYQRSPATEEKKVEKDDDSVDEDHDDIIPLLRFSTTSLAEKEQWMSLIAESCAYCQSRKFFLEDASASVQRSLSKIFAEDSLPKQSKGTLPRLILETPKMQRNPSGSTTPNKRNKKFLRVSLKKNAANTNPLSVAAYPPSKPMHRAAGPSYLSDDAPIQNYRGLLNLMVIVLVVANFRLVIDNIVQHGFFLSNIKIDMAEFTHAPLADAPFYCGFGLLQVFIISSYLIEKMLSRKTLGETIGFMLHMVNANAALFVPMAIVWFFMEGRPLPGSFLLLHSVITWMKLLSYLHANSDYRTRDPMQSTVALVKDQDEFGAQLSYPSNITLSNIYYFWFAPTLTYQIAFPRSARVRPTKVATLIIRIIVVACFLAFLVGQIIAPSLDSLARDTAENEGLFTPHIAAHYLTKLSLASTYAWLLFFYLFFHLYLNLFAEILRFGDRVFYRDWWNASEVASYWRLWNTPVHYWLVRHVYFPCLRNGMSKSISNFIVFFISAVMHEVLVSVPFHMIGYWSFLGMMGQIPLVAITKYIDKKIPGSSIGNAMFWLSFCIVGQPMAILLYCVDYFTMKNSASCEMVDGVCSS